MKNGLLQFFLSLRFKLLMLTAIPLIFIVALFFVALIQLQSLEQQLARDVIAKQAQSVQHHIQVATVRANLLANTETQSPLYMETRTQFISHMKSAIAQLVSLEKDIKSDHRGLIAQLFVDQRDQTLLPNINQFKAQWEKLNESFNAWEKTNQALAPTSKSLTINPLIEEFKQLQLLIDDIHNMAVKLAPIEINSVNDGINQISSHFFLVILMSLAGILIPLIAGYFITETIIRVIYSLKTNTEKIAHGDLTLSKINEGQDELGQLGHSLNEMVIQLRKLISEATKSAELVASTSEQLSASTDQATNASENVTESIQEVSQDTEKQAYESSQVQEVAQQISENVKQISDSIQLVNYSTIQTTDKADKGNLIISMAVDHMNVIDDRTSKISEIINHLGVKSEEIGRMISMITDISGQTNLLALNAAIEASRAGEHGRGFAVVADEVRKLAEQSGSAASQIKKTLNEIQASTDQAISATKVGIIAVREGIMMVNEAGSSFKEIRESVNDVTYQATEVKKAVEFMNMGSSQLLLAIEGISKLSQEIAGNAQSVAASTEEQNATFEEIASSSQMLSKLANELMDSISVFKIMD